ncbi:putative 1-acyl-sn-glycerol-3-phosphate acyltransferase acl-2 [Plodia interpunctella]|uniref:putative 1-acyl-sn-glycerol-3-phosphate acyltransferase acl-2 n=1 Tax=Plodia interpunctella TaxID=58824 RepID=UPI002367F151|nr:putative 1-acyl-sn-glycerol-3-phosphate acyltransferase acl-2 [Plodia interpunctella]XP_053600960.1 putative 1-acyl-sn-glycerol-3-phosphate acyltransferase acl-2 [Plodia interpunctella]XP_053600961.1 putative 1-acyl-sn-glycerol-3-phosphate acyltransferase acl-2 [Plodia interpunctella]XP_053600962.1 putative 1-acyl-sn-glycerol-3-phosphate acyltransferase acl-2 [Plodia interpunctella]XP_053600963.1 putative 1-acyl-sn-glycerol-3-phosphate acyltransferase acl-2 [Plodia interpunctella]
MSVFNVINVVLGCVMALLIILFTISSIARYYIKFTLFVVLSLVFATAPIPLMLSKPFDPKNALIPAALLRLTARVLGIRWTVRGLENVDNSRGAVVLLNHQSGIDLYILAVLWPLMERCTVVSKRSLQYLVPFGTAAWLWGTVFIDRGAQSARDALNKQTEAVRDHKRKLLLFPEGTRHSGDKLLPFRKGAFHVAMDAGAPILPIVVSKYHFLDSDRRRFGSGEIIITILPMIETKGVSKEDIQTLVDEAQSKMQEEFTKTTAETLARRACRTKAD